jgi:hypothetical protein
MGIVDIAPPSQRRSCIVWAGHLCLATVVVACGADGGTSGGTGGTAGASGGSGATSSGGEPGAGGATGGSGGTSGGASGGAVGTGGGATGGGATGGAGSGGVPASGGAGGETGGVSSGGTAGTGGSSGGSSLADVDLTLGGLNQDLPTPSTDCLALAKAPLVGCLSVTGSWMGESVDVTCQDAKGPASAGTQPPDRFVGCDATLPSGNAIEIIVRLGGDLVAPLPKAFSFAIPPGSDVHTRMDLTDVTRGYISHSGDAFALAGSYEEKAAVAGLADVEPGIRTGTTSEIEKGTFALTLTPTAGCQSGTAFECKPIRLRGSFLGRTVPKL